MVQAQLGQNLTRVGFSFATGSGRGDQLGERACGFRFCSTCSEAILGHDPIAEDIE